MKQLHLFNMSTYEKQRGSVLITTVLYVSIMLAIVLTITAILLPKLRASSISKNSVVALYAAQSGLEWCLYYIVQGEDPGDLPSMSNGATITSISSEALALDDCEVLEADLPLKVLGVYNGTTRAFEISF